MSASIEWWTEDHARFLHVEYENGVTQVSEEAMHELLKRAGFEQTEEPKQTHFTGDGRAKLREVARNLAGVSDE